MTNEEFHKQCKAELGHDIIALYDFVAYTGDYHHIYQVVEDHNTHFGFADNKVLWTLREFNVETMKYGVTRQYSVDAMRQHISNCIDKDICDRLKEEMSPNGNKKWYDKFLKR